MTARPMTEVLREASLEDAQSSWMDPAPRWAERSRLLSEAADEIERLSAAVRGMKEALEAIWQYGSDTLSGRADGGPDDRKWQRDAVLEMTNRASAAIEKATKP